MLLKHLYDWAIYEASPMRSLVQGLQSKPYVEPYGKLCVYTRGHWLLHDAEAPSLSLSEAAGGVSAGRRKARGSPVGFLYASWPGGFG